MFSTRFFSLSCCIGLALALGASPAAQREKLSVPLGASGDVWRFEVTPDGRNVVYIARQEQSGPLQLYGVGLPEGSSKRLESLPCTPDFEISSDGQRVVYERYLPPSSWETCSVAVDGSEDPVVLGGPSNFRISPDGHTVVLVDSSGISAVPIDGSTTPALIHAYTGIHFVFKFTPDGSRVLYITEGSINHNSGTGHLYSAPVDLSAPPVRLNDNQSGATIGSFESSPSGKWVVFRGGRLETFSKSLFSVPIEGGRAPVKLNPSPPVGSFSIFTDYHTPRFTPDGSRVVYNVDQEATGRVELYSAPIQGGEAPVKLNAPLPDGGRVFLHRVTQDGAQVVYTATQDSADLLELYSVPVLGGTPRKLSQPGEDVFLFKLSPDGRAVAYVADAEGDLTYQLFLASLQPAAGVIPLSDPGLTPRVQTGLPSVLEFDADGRRVSFLSYELENNMYSSRQLHAVRTDGSTRPIRLDGPSVHGANVVVQEPPFPQDEYWMRFAAGDSLAVFAADLERDDVVELWASPFKKSTLSRR